jgi:ADP-ribose pyrophosphatase YjhB (NUDIX family)
MSKILYCNNCGKQGHISNDCKIPITSVGIILLRYHENKPNYLFVRRKETFGYSDLVRGKYPIYNKTFIQNLVNEMTLDEKRKIKSVINEIENENRDPNETILKRYYTCIKMNREMGYEDIDLTRIINDSTSKWKDPEWGFPKGRRNYQEKDLDCALREFEEETGYLRHEITLIENLIPLEEIFTGSNYKIYKHRYYLAKLNNDNNVKIDTFQESEISKMEWFDTKKSLDHIRPYNKEKKNIVDTVNGILNQSFFYFSS